MKQLMLVCNCKARRMFYSDTIDELLTKIDASGWSDYSDDARALPRGEQHGWCPTCLNLDPELRP